MLKKEGFLRSHRWVEPLYRRRGLNHIDSAAKPTADIGSRYAAVLELDMLNRKSPAVNCFVD